MTEMQAAIGRIQLARMADWHQRRVEIANRIWDTAKQLPNAELHILRGMAHDFPTPLLPEIAERIHDTAQRAAS